MPLSQCISRSNRAHLGFFVATAEQKRSCNAEAIDAERILAEMASPDERVRARAVRQVGPCRMPWPVFYELRKAAARLKRDPSPLVRANALHIEVDARTVRDREATMARLQADDERGSQRTRRGV